ASTSPERRFLISALPPISGACRRVGPSKRAGSLAPAAAADELVEPARFSVLGPVLVQKGEFVFFKRLEELVPVDRLERLVVVTAGLVEIDPEDSATLFVAGGIHAGWAAAAFLDPAASLVVI